MPRLTLSADPFFPHFKAKRHAVCVAVFFLASMLIFGSFEYAKAGFVERLSGIDALKNFESEQDSAQKALPGPDKTPLMAASQNGDIKAVKALLAKGSRVNAKDRAGNTALIFACFSGHLNGSGIPVFL